MATNTQVVKKGAAVKTDASTSPVKQGGRSTEAPVTPPVDIWEDDDGITLCADMPGVSKDGLDLRADGHNLTIEGRMKLDIPEGAAALYADVHSSLYRRSFTLGSELETKHVDASFKDGVLTLRIPKRAELKPHKIDVRVR
ncbi:MAG TPA: Hsp20/alpha crystallin family protein [Rhodanobacteraceae bacterium]|jgi:HSP20 family molecular chaperone IbpA